MREKTVNRPPRLESSQHSNPFPLPLYLKGGDQCQKLRLTNIESARAGIQFNKNEKHIMKIPSIIITPPDWLAVPMASGFGLLFISIIIVLKDLVRLLP
mgnify:CR=1 FL=1